MSVRFEIPENDGVYFITFTCCNWLPLFEIAKGYHSVYDWFDYFKKQGHMIAGYVIMPNHVHVIIAFRNTKGKSINKIVGNGKRFMAYDLVKRLKDQGHDNLLLEMESFVNHTDRKRGKLHEVFEPSFDWKECLSNTFTEQKLEYIHNNPCTGKWNLVASPELYVHSSGRFYATGEQGIYEVINYMYLQDINLTKREE